jgi:flagellar capping protein FliD
MTRLSEFLQPFLLKIIGFLVALSLALLTWIGKSIDTRLGSIALEIKATNTVVINMQNQFKDHQAEYRARFLLLEHRMNELEKKGK